MAHSGPKLAWVFVRLVGLFLFRCRWILNLGLIKFYCPFMLCIKQEHWDNSVLGMIMRLQENKNKELQRMKLLLGKVFLRQGCVSVWVLGTQMSPLGSPAVTKQRGAQLEPALQPCLRNTPWARAHWRRWEARSRQSPAKFLHLFLNISFLYEWGRVAHQEKADNLVSWVSGLYSEPLPGGTR